MAVVPDVASPRAVSLPHSSPNIRLPPPQTFEKKTGNLQNPDDFVDDVKKRFAPLPRRKQQM